MSSFARNVKKEQEKQTLKFLFRKEPKHRCKKCHRMTLYNAKGECVYCSGEFDERLKSIYDKMKNQKIKGGEPIEKVRSEISTK